MTEYISLYRKYRPKKFSEVVGQTTTINILKNSIKLNKIGHAYIFSGPRGTGKTSVAKIFSRAVNCLNSVDGDVCGKCDNCLKKIEDEIDIIEIDAASNNGVDEIREIRNNVKLLPSNLKYKIYIIDEVHMLSDSAFNALLKTLEEPPSHVIFILATTEINKIPSTVLSRCQKFNFKKLNDVEIEERLKYICKNENRLNSVDDNCIKLIADLSDGGLRDAINLLDQSLSLNENIKSDDIYNLLGIINDEEQFYIIKNIVNGNIKDTINCIDLLYSQGKNIPSIVNQLQTKIENIIIYNSTNNYFSNDYEKKLSQFSKIDLDKLIDISKQMFDLLYNMKKSTDQKILIKIYFIKMTLTFFDNSLQKNDSNNLKIKKDGKDVNDSDSETSIVDNKNILINNCLSLANKKSKIEFIDKFNMIKDYVTDKKYNSIANLLLKSSPEVVSEKNILFTFDKEFEVILFDKNIDLIVKFLKLLYNIEYEVVGISSEDWKEIKKEYISNVKKGIKYVYTDIKNEKIVSNDVKNVEDKIENIFGNIHVTEE